MTGAFAKGSFRRLLLVAGLGVFVLSQPLNAGENQPAPLMAPEPTKDAKAADDPLESINRVTS